MSQQRVIEKPLGRLRSVVLPVVDEVATVEVDVRGVGSRSCLSGWLRIIQPAVGNRLMHRRQPENRLEGGHGGAPSVEAEGELVEVDLEMGVTDAVVRTDEPGFEVSEDPVDAGQ